ncbi:DNA-directed RNA polymerase alpha chain [Mycoplasmopsis californica HAZ160_1]|uniref:DNA-directed RNA polymerase subunit alpha n=2 Tax=Mycoplasmopsis californica TaxID=2113 RepID=A0A059XW62_9BACT|nr:DNA-directed RNA polymerase subunit alpha [Mycoplasmopsis californica]AIA29482.1 DNA-directed RNA polymerase subunit alpha [Mycoplasmopsis californica]BAP01073.1 DNA-directed RNA polymerase alpha chain [Mycoplasmopsis californica HAZ160_1]BBG40937.1 DNA-directed RNA polymerase alpha chain [Mycoplasmopsis californica]BBG41531.1 DNA-directed RNA polymerase alpha chain [Mycoplasmopsis californica]BBG42124.1 DNA-directed RNA polymerase alpha chain [Mycoplasmopsis californica]
MEKMAKLDYTQLETINANVKEVNHATFALQPLERGFGQTVAVALRRVLLSNITSLAMCAVKIEDVEHEFQVINGVVEDVTSLIMNLRKVKFQYSPELVNDDEVIKVVLNVDKPGPVTSRSLEVVNSNIEITSKSIHLATISGTKGKLHLEMFLRPGRGFISNEKNKKLIASTNFLTQIHSNIKKGILIATDSNFSPIENVNYKINELNSASTDIEERLEFSVTTDGTVGAKEAIKQACEIIIGHFQIVGNVEGMMIDNIFKKDEVEKEVVKEENDLDISALNLSVRSLNALRKIGKVTLSQIAQMTYEELENTKNLGKKSLDEIVSKLKEFDYELAKGEE